MPAEPNVIVYDTYELASTTVLVAIVLPAFPVSPSINCRLLSVTFLLLLFENLHLILLPLVIRLPVCEIEPPVHAADIYWVISMSD